MRGRLLIIIAFLVVLVAVVVVFVLLPPQGNRTQPLSGTPGATVVDLDVTPSPTATEVRLVPLYIALFDLPRGTRITEDMVRLVEYPEANAPFNAIANPEDIIGKIASTDVYREQPVLQTMVVDDLFEIGRPRSEASSVLPPGTVAISVPMDRLTSVAYAIRDGDSVDIIISLLFVDVDETFGSIEPNNVRLILIVDGVLTISEPVRGRLDTSPTFGDVFIEASEPQRPRLVTQRIISGALVVHVGDFPRDGIFISVPPTPTPVPVAESEDGTVRGTQVPTPVPPRPDIITIAVSPQEAVVLTWAVEARLPITFALRPSADTTRIQTEPVTLDYIMDSYGIDLPPRRPYNIQPPITSIRQLITAEEISFNQPTAVPSTGN